MYYYDELANDIEDLLMDFLEYRLSQKSIGTNVQSSASCNKNSFFNDTSDQQAGYSHQDCHSKQGDHSHQDCHSNQDCHSKQGDHSKQDCHSNQGDPFHSSNLHATHEPPDYEPAHEDLAETLSPPPYNATDQHEPSLADKLGDKFPHPIGYNNPKGVTPNDKTYMRHLMGEINKSLLPYVKKALDDFEYEGSPTHDEEIDRETIAQIIDRALEYASVDLPEVEEILLEPERHPWIRARLLRAALESLVLYELYNVRRPIYRKKGIIKPN